jgi:YHS domain-containing protein
MILLRELLGVFDHLRDQRRVRHTDARYQTCPRRDHCDSPFDVDDICRTPKEEIMVREYLTSAVAGALLLGMAAAALAVTGEYGNMCTMGLALGKDIQTDCSINAQVQGKTYCFGSKEAMAEFMKNPTANLAKAQTYYSKKHPG